MTILATRRRNVVFLGVCLTTVWGFAAALRAADAPALCCRIMCYGKYQDDAWEHLPAIGIHNIFIAIPQPEKVDDTMRRLAAHGLTPLVMRGELDLTRPTSVDAAEPQLAACQKMGCHYMFISPKHPGASKEEACDRLRRAGDIARRYGVTIVLETHPDLGTNADEHLQTMRRINHPNVRVNFDTGNIHFYNQHASAPAELKKIIDYVATMEVKDHNGQYMDWTFPTLGQGIVDFPAIVQILQEHKFHGPVTMEIEGVRGHPWSEQETLKAVADSAAYLRKLAAFQ